ncbi:MAG: bifunctional phosphoribosyl-AMP cyclohydrolase/phosphoribosyl-ATP diphosphatase HisIE [Deltaproteobacteria bacterium]|nr:bifunctional phosphoribosyl-AMP cyclohydrolase/phosphoribosyl-ATP diphosphatase HisIE [Deltaproteobacteria bacterium]
MEANIILSGIKFDEKGLVPAIAQEAATGEVLMLAYMNMEAVEKTLSTGKAHYFSRSRDRLWMKGETSGNFQEVRRIYYDCDADAILLKVRQTGAACHTGLQTCFSRRLDKGGEERAEGPSVLTALFKTILERKKTAKEKSYVSHLYSKGFGKIAEKIYEESAEFINAAKKEGKDEIIRELTDLWFHTLVLLGYMGVDIMDVFDEFGRRYGKSGIEEKESRGKD